MHFFISLCVLLSTNNQVTLSPHAYTVSERQLFTKTGPYFYYNDFEQYDEFRAPWRGNDGFALWFALISDSAHSGKKILIGRSRSRLSEPFVISDTFAIDSNVHHVSIKMQLRFWVGNNTWQVVPQGNAFVMARFIVNPDGQISVFDADSGDEPTETQGRVKLLYYDDSWDTLEFKLDRRAGRYAIFLNGERIHQGTPFSTDVTSLVYTQTTRDINVHMQLDTIEVTEDLQAVPTLSTTGIILLCLGLGFAAILMRKQHRSIKQTPG